LLAPVDVRAGDSIAVINMYMYIILFPLTEYPFLNHKKIIQNIVRENRSDAVWGFEIHANYNV
jgi:hypothetical protein